MPLHVPQLDQLPAIGPDEVLLVSDVADDVQDEVRLRANASRARSSPLCTAPEPKNQMKSRSLAGALLAASHGPARSPVTGTRVILPPEPPREGRERPFVPEQRGRARPGQRTLVLLSLIHHPTRCATDSPPLIELLDAAQLRGVLKDPGDRHRCDAWGGFGLPPGSAKPVKLRVDSKDDVVAALGPELGRFIEVDDVDVEPKPGQRSRDLTGFPLVRVPSETGVILLPGGWGRHVADESPAPGEPGGGGEGDRTLRPAQPACD